MHAKSQWLSSYSFRDLSVHPDARTDGLDSASDPEQEYIYFLGSETVPSTSYILSTNLVYPFTLRVTGITKKNDIVEYLYYQIPDTQLKGQMGNGNMHAAKRD